MATVPAAPRTFGGCGKLLLFQRFINADGIFQIFGFQTDCVHFRSSFLEEPFHALQRVAVGHGQHPLGQIDGEGAAAGKHRGAQRGICT